jgi:hypothetical protein
MANEQLPQQDVSLTPGEPHRTNLFTGSFLMVAITLLLFFLPAINGIIGGLVGGYKVGSVGRALVAAILPAVLASIGLWILLALLDLPVIVGFLAGTAVALLVILSDLGIFIGAAIGGAISPHRA